MSVVALFRMGLVLYHAVVRRFVCGCGGGVGMVVPGVTQRRLS